MAALMVGTYLMRANPQVAHTSPTPAVSVSATPAPTPGVVVVPRHEPDNCPACGMAVRSPRDQDFIQRTQEQRKPKKS